MAEDIYKRFIQNNSTHEINIYVKQKDLLKERLKSTFVLPPMQTTKSPECYPKRKSKLKYWTDVILPALKNNNSSSSSSSSSSNNSSGSSVNANGAGRNSVNINSLPNEMSGTNINNSVSSSKFFHNQKYARASSTNFISSSHEGAGVQGKGGATPLFEYKMSLDEMKAGAGVPSPSIRKSMMLTASPNSFSTVDMNIVDEFDELFSYEFDVEDVRFGHSNYLVLFNDIQDELEQMMIENNLGEFLKSKLYLERQQGNSLS
ncbi:hypothetical protein SAMD00019534_033800 [Acytostelium subglobosum LB1]|uniref:hypothetical protein n=1 Tax=Acytostelium subglobosum LB1 TaxID=1410327 RepID=UPI000644983A|nr:hypothetical protein SAMD00019534_033800 [Acytostelium subglobosum LB1]GAM20205.1 hypothetical protein SAMD00019534_033800 [Acytostelium subglobosum LB1]|eukprot:XP_012759726.1 hypothetical protein SAMD00019534_033800 [Acytostelium subglobosum LB1]